MAVRKRSYTQQRQRLAYEAARMIAEGGEVGYDRVRRKAAERAGVADKRSWPSNEEIQEALVAHRRLFSNDVQASGVRGLREEAVAAMRHFESFRPRLVGSVLAGTAERGEGVRLFLFADNPEDVVLRLIDRGIPWEERSSLLRYRDGTRQKHPCFRFLAGETPFELVVLPELAHRNPPLDPVSDRPEKGATLTQVVRMVEESVESENEGGRVAGV